MADSVEQNEGKIQAQLSLLSKMRGKQKKLWGKIIHNNSTSVDDKEDEQSMPIEKTNPKGSLLDRIASLEDRLVQLCLEIESFKKSSYNSSKDKSSGASSSSAGSKTERICSYPTFDIPNPQLKTQPPFAMNINNLEFKLSLSN
ncbi:hypothetical protein M9H77_00267 [Catharanthus roseus]|nr:hypothetical protein M9H77_00267 [Catharanthus roseus]